jgi:formylglycine-generating enzyme required for sulfatase activity
MGSLQVFGIIPEMPRSNVENEPDKIKEMQAKENKGKFKSIDSDFIELVEVPAGVRKDLYIWYGKEIEYKIHTEGFCIGKYPITQAQYEAIMGKQVSNEGGNNPVLISREDEAQTFCQKLSQKIGKTCKLPSSDQWEYACRAYSNDKYCFGNDKNQLQDYAWYDYNSGGTTHPVGQKKPNNWGLYDMHGNVWELCENDYKYEYEDFYEKERERNERLYSIEEMSRPTIIPPLRKYKCLRGGSWQSNSHDCRSESNQFMSNSPFIGLFGFRIVVTDILYKQGNYEFFLKCTKDKSSNKNDNS